MNINTDFCLLKVDKPNSNTHRFAMFHIAAKEPNVLHIYRNNVDMTFQEIQVQLEQLGFDFSNMKAIARDLGKLEVIYEGGKPDGMTLATAGYTDYLLTDMYSKVAMSYENQYGFPMDLRYSYDAVPYHFLLNSIQDASYKVKRTNLSNNGVLKEEDIAKADMGFHLIFSVPKYLDENVAQEEREADKEDWNWWLSRKNGKRIVPIKKINILDVKPTESPITVAKPEKRPIETTANDTARETLKKMMREKMIKERDAIKTEKSVEVSDKMVKTVKPVVKSEPKTLVEPVVKSEPKTPVEPVVKSEPKTTVAKTENTLGLNDYKVLQYLSGYEAPKKDKDGKRIYEPPREKLSFSGKHLGYNFKASQVYVKVTIFNPLAEKQKYEVVYYHPLADEKMYIITSEKDRSFVDFKQSLNEKYLLKFSKIYRRERYVKDGFAEYGIKDGSLVNDNKVIYSYSNLKDFYLGANTKIKSILQENSDLMYAVQQNNEFVIKSAVTDEAIKTVNSKADVENELGKTHAYFDAKNLTRLLVPVKDLDDLFMNFPVMAEKMGVQIERLTV